MAQILFIHGTGGRRSSFDETLKVLRKQAGRHLAGKNVNVRGCLWGEPEGAKLRLQGASIPTYDDQPAAAVSEKEAERMEEVTWRMLGEDPLFELRLLESVPAPKQPQAPGQSPPGVRTWKLLQGFVAPQELIDSLEDLGLSEYWQPAQQSLLGQKELEGILIKANRDPRETSRALSRALVACLIAEASAGGHPGISADTRERLVDLLIPHLGQQALAAFDWVTKPLLGLAKRYGTYKARRERRALSDASYGAAGDILLYQTRGRGIRRFICQEIAKMDDGAIVFAHSLGGIAAVDVLVLNDFSQKVRGLVTVGSQAPFLYEINALRSLPFGRPLPDHFPKKWLNIWDPNDFLSYEGARVFGTNKVTDVMVRSKLAFPDSHSAYWDLDATWNAVKGFFPWL